MSYKISIVHADASTGKLTLEPNDTVYVDKGKRVVWSISETVLNVDSFKIDKKSRSEEIFTFLDRPPHNYTKKGGGTVGWFTRDRAEYEYSIDWIDTDENKHTHDPKISVNPSDDDDYMKVFIGLAVALFAAMLTFGFVQRKRSRK